MNKSFLEYLEKYKHKKIFFYGASLFLENFLKENPLKDYNILGIIDKDTRKKIKKYKIIKFFHLKYLIKSSLIV